MMTGLKNRAAFIDDSNRDAHTPGAVSYIMIDANNLKKVNDSLGHKRGDELLTTVARCMEAGVKKYAGNGRCYRIGGDEFVVLYPEIKQAEFEYFVSQLQKNAKEHQVNISYGVVWKEICENLEDLLTEADKKMYEDKKLYYSNTKHNRRGQIERNSLLFTAEKKVM